MPTPRKAFENVAAGRGPSGGANGEAGYDPIAGVPGSVAHEKEPEQVNPSGNPPGTESVSSKGLR